MAKVSQVLLSHECQRINFRWGEQHINAKAYRAVVLALVNSRIHLYEANAAHKLDDGVEASYRDSGDTMIIRPRLNLHKVSNRRTIVHEATHAVQDAELADVDVWRLDKEAIAFVAEWLYLIYSSPDPDNLRNDPNPNDPIEVIALEIAQSLAGKPAPRPTPPRCGVWGMRSTPIRPIRSACCCTRGPTETAFRNRISLKGSEAARTSRKFRLRTLPLALRGSAPSRRRNVSGTL